ncbi:hypothetical protein CROQUDRAFT_464401 [Cronartium quercuum f. sp. fusiforme G11]|uniref:Uncharacterized protein n=1 Tax=Cronartium quercuum f. sp. fusiforme G11 TaxID=708437 RepID=A0A9P6NQY6_9BASI|nr:hypothetical protein CROQUDRAFT_464401 [Cronartium quercuum f. sp. fusiforme G11]
MSRWTNNILFRHGDLVQYGSVQMVPDWLKGGSGTIHVCDHLTVQHGDLDFRSSRGLSYKNTVKILTMCPNVCSLKSDLPQLVGSNDEVSFKDLNLLYSRVKQIVLHFLQPLDI